MSTNSTVSAQWRSRPADERFTSLLDLRDHKLALKQRSREVQISTRKFQIVPEGLETLTIQSKAGVPYTPTNWSLGQICQLAKVPADYLRTLPAPIAADCLNYGLKFARSAADVQLLLQKPGELLLPSPSNPSQEILPPTSAPGILSAATGPRYGRIWDGDFSQYLVEMFGDGLTGQWKQPGEFGSHVEITKQNCTLYASDRDLFVFLCDEENKIHFNRPTRNSKGLSRGFYCWNSEVGNTSFGAAFFLFDYACCNRILWGVEGFQEFRLRHTQSAPDRWLEEVQPMLLEYANASERPILNALDAAKAKKLDNVEDFLSSRFTKNISSMAQIIHMDEEDRPIETLWDAVTGLTAFARTIQNQDIRVGLEREAGKLLKLAV